MKQHELNGKDYYEILKVSPDAEPAEITVAYERLASLYQHLLSIMPDVSIYSERMADINEAYEVLSEPASRAAYDSTFDAKYESQDAEAEGPTTEEIADSMELLAQEVSKRKMRKTWRLPGWSKVAQRAVLIAVVSIFLMIGGGSSLAFAKPEHTLATPFKGVATTVVGASFEAISLIEDSRGLIATYERGIISTALQSMRVTEGLKEVPTVTVPTSDMKCFPSPEHPLFPDYLDKRFSQFRYTVDSTDIVSVDTSGATTDAFLEKIGQLLERLAERE